MSTRRTRGAYVLLAAAMLSLAAPVAHAEDPDGSGDTADGWKKVLAYAGCAINVFRAITPVDWVVAMSGCTKLFLDEPPLTSGGD
jgi:hypothetical protein